MAKQFRSQDDTWKEFIINQVNDMQEARKIVHSKSYLISELEKAYRETYHKSFPVSNSTIRRFLEANRFYHTSKYSYGFNNPKVSFGNTIRYLDCQKHICFLLEEPSLGTFLAELVNNHYSSPRVGLGKYVHCVALQDLLVCFYSESPDKKITAEILARDIPTILSRFYYSRNIE